MKPSNVTISLNYSVPVQDAVALLQKLLAVLPHDAAVATNHQASVPRSWPAVPPKAGEAYAKVAEENLRQLAEGTVPDDGWGQLNDLKGVIDSLRSETRAVVWRAIENGGHVSRDEVYELLGRDRSKSLKGFTRPAASLTERLIAAGELSSGAKQLLAPIYQKSKTYQQAQGFAVPVQVVSLMDHRTALDSQGSSGHDIKPV
jgi:hypothetical protein